MVVGSRQSTRKTSIQPKGFCDEKRMVIKKNKSMAREFLGEGNIAVEVHRMEGNRI